MKRFVTIFALALCAALPVAAQADFRTGNTWMQTPKSLAGTVKLATFNKDGRAYTSSYVICKGDLDSRYSRSARGFYHHMFCAAVLRGSDYFASFEAWQIGPNKENYRVTNLKYLL
jgi:hypothetical protein